MHLIKGYVKAEQAAAVDLSPAPNPKSGALIFRSTWHRKRWKAARKRRKYIEEMVYKEDAQKDRFRERIITYNYYRESISFFNQSISSVKFILLRIQKI